MIESVKRKQPYVLYALAIVIFGFVLYQLFEINHKTEQNVEAVKRAVEQLEEDHDGQDALAVCLGKLVIATQSRTVTDADYEQCVITTAVPPMQTSGGTEPSNQANSSSQSPGNQPSVSSSSLNSTANTSNNQPNNSQNPPENPPEPPQSILPLVDEPIIGCPVGELCI